MPRLRYRTPKLCHHKSSGQGYAKFNGKAVWFGPWGEKATQEAYDRYVAEWLHNGREFPKPKPPSDDPVPVAEVIAAYWDHAEGYYSYSKASQIHSALNVVSERYGSTDAEAFGPKRLKVIRSAMLAKGWSRKYINDQCKWIRRMFRWAASEELVSEAIHLRLKTVEGLKAGRTAAKDYAKVTPVPRGHVRAIRRHLTAPVRALIRLQQLTAARADEFVRLRPMDLDTSGDVWVATFEKHKTSHRDKQRIVYFGPKAQRILKMFMRPGAASVNKPFFSPRDSLREAKARLTTKGQPRRANQKPNPRETDRTIGDAFTTASYRRQIHRACKEAGIKNWGPHRLRHAAATFLRREFGLEVARIILGHANSKTTEDYAKAQREHQKAMKVISKVG